MRRNLVCTQYCAPSCSATNTQYCHQLHLLRRFMFLLIKSPSVQPVAHQVFLHSLRLLFSWFNKYNKKLIYPPNPNQITTKNRLYPTYIEHSTELGTLLLGHEPLLLNFTLQGDPECNKVTGALFDILSDKSKYPLDVSKPVSLANITCDSSGGRELQQTYAVSKIPTVVLLKKQMLVDRFIPTSPLKVSEELTEWIKSIY